MSHHIHQSFSGIHTPLEQPNPFSRPSTPEIKNDDRVAFIGLGNMGQPMALNLAIQLQKDQQPPLIVWNRSSDRVDEFLKLCKAGKDGGGEVPVEVAKSAKEVGEKADVVFTSLGSDTGLIAVYDEVFQGHESRSKGQGLTCIDTSTIAPETAGKLERLASKVHGRHFLACPAFGRPHAAAARELVFAISGSYHAKKRAAHMLVPALGRKVMDLGSNVEKAASFKLCGNGLIVGMIEVLAETFTLAEQSGVGQENMYALIKELWPAPIMQNYAKKLIKNEFNGKEGFTLDGGIKDCSHIRKLAEQHNVPVPVVDIAHQHLISARANGGSKLDWSALVGGVRLAAGLPPFKENGRFKLEKY